MYSKHIFQSDHQRVLAQSQLEVSKSRSTIGRPWRWNLQWIPLFNSLHLSYHWFGLFKQKYNFTIMRISIHPIDCGIQTRNNEVYRRTTRPKGVTSSFVCSDYNPVLPIYVWLWPFKRWRRELVLDWLYQNIIFFRHYAT